MTNILSGEERVTASCLKPLLNHLHNEALAEKEGDTTLKSDIQQRIKEYMKRNYDDESVISTLNIFCCLDPRFMLKYCDDDDEAIAIRQSIIQQGLIIARRMEEQRPPADGEKEKQEESAGPSAAPTKKRRLVDILCNH